MIANETRRHELLERVIQLGKTVAGVTEWRACLHTIYWSVRDGLGFDRVGLFVCDPRRRVLTGAYGTDRQGNIEDLMDLVHPYEWYADILSSPSGFRYTENFSAQTTIFDTMHDVGEHVLAVCWAGDHPAGIIAADNLVTGRPMTAEQLDALRLFAGYAGLAMQNARLLEQAQAAEQRYRTIFERAVEGIFQSTPDGRFVSANPAMARILGYDSPEELIASFTDLRREAFADPGRRDELMRRLELHGEVRGMESEIVRRDGRRIWISGSTRAVRDEHGQIVLLEGIVEDITERKRAEATLRRSLARLEILHEIDRSILAEHAPEEIAAAALSHIRHLIPAQRASVTLLDREADQIVLLAVSVAGQTTRLSGEHSPVGDPDVIATLQRGQPILVDDVLLLPERTPLYQRLLDEGIRTWLFAPLMYQGELVGSLNLGAAAPGTFTADHAEVAGEVANQLAIAIQQARLLEQTAEALARERRLNELSRTIGGRLDSHEVITTVMRLAAELVNVDSCMLGIVAPDGESMAIPYAYNFPTGAPPPVVPRGQTPLWRIFDGGRAEVMNDYPARPTALAPLVQAGVQAVLGVPVIAGETRLGVMAFYATRPGQRFCERDAALAESVGRQAGLALQNARLFEAVQQRVAVLSALYEIGLDVSAQLDLPSLLKTIVERALCLLDAPAGAVYLLRPDEGALELVASIPGEATGSRLPLGQGLAGAVAESGLPLVLMEPGPDPEQHPLFAPLAREIRAGVPIIWSGRTVGVLQVTSKRVGQFGPEAIETMRLLAAQAAVAIQNAQLFAAAHAAEEQVRNLNVALEHRVAERTAQLKLANQELEAFSSSVSHDLRAPLRIIDGFSQALLEDYHARLDDEGRGYLRIVREECQRMRRLIDDLLKLAHVTRSEIHRGEVDLTALAEAILEQLRRRAPERELEAAVAPGLVAYGDDALIQVLMQNLLENAWKFSSRRERPRIEVGAEQGADGVLYFVRDNGAGFDMAYAYKLFSPFQRLHSQAEFEGTGIGLATVQRIISRHGGRVWAQSAVDQGATFYFTLPREIED
ncbi:MAG TPA: GAF domain-containing protein [Roseiflexaceae bacterium]|nr:GAF domain-containing protein [Roseiflexaceae bacterium]